MRLIDADLLKGKITKWLKPSKPDETEMIEVADALVSTMMEIDKQPTAYDVDKVRKRLENELELADKEKERCARENQLQFDSAKWYATGIYNAIEIVKGGGVD